MILPPYLYDIQKSIEAHARSFGLDFYEQVFEILDYRTMNEVAAYGGFPTRYPHWRFGMDYEQLSKSYAYGLSKIYEMVINNDPCYAYLLEGNSLVDQKLVIAHVCAHNDFFKNNYYFSKTNRKMIDEMANHATRIRRIMERYGIERVEGFIDVCLSIDNLIDPMSMFIQREARPMERRTQDEVDAADEEERPRAFKLKAKSYMEKYINPPDLDEEGEAERRSVEEKKDELPPKFPARPQRDVMKFLLEHAPLDPWQQDLIDLVREETYYFAPQGMTKIMNEGWATYWHSKIMTQKVLDDSEVIDYADHAAGVLGGRSLNPYKIGYELFKFIEERWNTGRFGKEWEECEDLEARRAWDRKLGGGLEKIFQVRSIFNDVMFIDEFFTEEFCREQLFFTYGWNERTTQWEIQSREFQKIKAQLLGMLTHMGNPFVEVEDGNFENRGELLLRHRHEGTDLRIDWARDTLANLYKIWRRPTNLLTKVEEKGKLLSFDGKDHTERGATFE
jgi:stage V sporulation protein R